MMADIDFSLIKLQLIIFILSLLFCVAIVLGANSYYQSEIQIKRSMEQSFQDVKDKLDKRLEGNAIFMKIKHKLHELNGFSYAWSDKLGWMEVLQREGERHGLPSMTFNISARMPDQQFGQQLIEDRVYKTKVEINAGLVHGAQLLDVVESLKNADLGMFSVEQCALEKNRAKFQVNKANVLAQCLIEWYEIDDPVDAMMPEGMF